MRLDPALVAAAAAGDAQGMVNMTLAEALQTAAPSDNTRYAWTLICQAIPVLDWQVIDDCIEALGNGQDYLMDELGLEFLDGELRVSFLRHSEMTDSTAILAALVRARSLRGTPTEPSN